MRIRLEEPELLLARPALTKPRISLGGARMRKVGKLRGNHLFYVGPLNRCDRSLLTLKFSCILGDHVLDFIGMNTVILCFRKAEKAYEECGSN